MVPRLFLEENIEIAAINCNPHNITSIQIVEGFRQENC